MLKVCILGDKLLRGTGCSVIRINDTVYKIGFNSRGRKAVLSEFLILKDVKKDVFFSEYALSAKYNGLFLKMKYAEAIAGFEPNQYFQKYFSVCPDDKDAVKNLICHAELNRVTSLLSPRVREALSAFCENFYLPKFQTHGDFHSGNILNTIEGVYFLDWGNYRKNGSPYFDLIHYLIFQRQAGAWTKRVENFWKSNVSRLYGIDISKNIILAYALHMITQDIKMGKASTARLHRYAQLIVFCFENL